MHKSIVSASNERTVKAVAPGRQPGIGREGPSRIGPSPPLVIFHVDLQKVTGIRSATN